MAKEATEAKEATGASGGAGNPSTTPTAPKRQNAQQFVTELCVPPPSGALIGQPIGLLEAVSSARDRVRPAEAVQAYWRLSGAIGEYHGWVQAVDGLGRLVPKSEDIPAWSAARVGAIEQLRQAEKNVQRAQQSLLDQTTFSTNNLLPLPLDAPHAGLYRTVPEQDHARRNAPPVTRLLHRLIQLRRQAVELRVKAIVEADSVAEASIAAYAKSQAELPGVVGWILHASLQRRLLAKEIEYYNDDIVDYVLGVMGPQGSPTGLVAMLIKTRTEPAPGQTPTQTDTIQTPDGRRSAAPNARASQPLAQATSSAGVPGLLVVVPEPPAGTRASADAQSPVADVPHLAPRYDRPGQPSPRTIQDSAVTPTSATAIPTGSIPAPSRAETGGTSPSERTRSGAMPGSTVGRPSASSRETLEEAPRSNGGPVLEEAPPWNGPAATQGAPQLAPIGRPNRPAAKTPPAAARSAAAESRTTTSDRRVQRTAYFANAPAAAADAPTGAWFGSIASLTDSARAQRLGQLLHEVRDASREPNRQASLRDMLTSISVNDRRGVIDSYWITAQRVADREVWTQYVDTLKQLAPLAVSQGMQSDGAIQLMQLTAMQRAAEVQLVHAQAALAVAQFDLVRRTSQSVDVPWPVPNTPPHAGPYRLDLEPLPRELRESASIRRLAVAVPALHGDLIRRANAVLAADQLRAASAAAYRTQGRSIEPLLTLLQLETLQTLSFLDTLTAYNRTMAEYALAVLPPGVTAENLVQTLVTRKP